MRTLEQLKLSLYFSVLDNLMLPTAIYSLRTFLSLKNKLVILIFDFLKLRIYWELFIKQRGLGSSPVPTDAHIIDLHLAAS